MTGSTPIELCCRDTTHLCSCGLGKEKAVSVFEDLPADVDQDEALKFHLVRAEQHLYSASQVVYATSGPIRGFWYRRKLLKAQDLAIRLSKYELQRKEA